MSTRCNIVLHLGQSRVYIYRHHDGYLAETGADILQKLRAAYGTENAHRSPEGTANAFLRAIMAEHYEKQSYESAPRAVYELTNGLHGDIEHAYIIDFEPHFNTGALSIRHCARPDQWHATGAEVDDWTGPGSGRRYSLTDFAEAVNADRKACNERIAHLRKTSKLYADCADYAML